MPKDHAFLSASGSARWIACPPSAALEAQFPEETSPYAEEGTLAHSLCEIEAGIILDIITPSEYLKKKQEIQKSPYYSQEMQECAENYAAFIIAALEDKKKLCQDAFAELEVRLDFSKYVKDGFGTGDCIIVSDGELQVIDFKYGKGVRVEANGNSQMRLYALGALAAYGDLYDFKQVATTIIQPRISMTPSTDIIKVKDLETWGSKTVKPAAKLAVKGEGDFNPPEETCRFCRARGCCKARANENMKLFEESGDALTLTPDEAGEILKKASDIEAWLKDLKEFVAGTLLQGTPIQGWKMVEGRSTRKISDELKAVEILNGAGYPSEVLYEKKLLGLTGLESVVGKKRLAELLAEVIVKPKGSPALAPASDPRKEWVSEEQTLEDFDK